MKILAAALVLLSLRALAAEPSACAAAFSEKRESNRASARLSTPVEKSADRSDDDEQSLSQAIRSKTVHYWSWAGKNVKLLGPFAEAQGLVVGDPHFGNFSIIPVRSAAGRSALRFLDIDFDDAGVGPFAFDFARFVITVKAVTKEVKVKDMVDAYIDGLKGVAYEEPKKIRKLLDLSMSDYDELEQAYVDKKIEGDRFENKPGKIIPYNGKFSRAAITALFPAVDVLDIATRPLEGGSNPNSERIWVLVRGTDGQKHIEEIKSFEPSALVKIGPQPAPMELVRLTQSKFWSGLDGSEYDLRELQGELIWVRGKKVTLLDIPYQMKSDGKAEFVAELSIYDANYLGRLHGAQASAKPYLKLIKEKKDDFREALKNVMHGYLDLF